MTLLSPYINYISLLFSAGFTSSHHIFFYLSFPHPHGSFPIPGTSLFSPETVPLTHPTYRFRDNWFPTVCVSLLCIIRLAGCLLCNEIPRGHLHDHRILTISVFVPDHRRHAKTNATLSCLGIFSHSPPNLFDDISFPLHRTRAVQTYAVSSRVRNVRDT